MNTIQERADQNLFNAAIIRLVKQIKVKYEESGISLTRDEEIALLDAVREGSIDKWALNISARYDLPSFSQEEVDELKREYRGLVELYFGKEAPDTLTDQWVDKFYVDWPTIRELRETSDCEFRKEIDIRWHDSVEHLSMMRHVLIIAGETASNMSRVC